MKKILLLASLVICMFNVKSQTIEKIELSQTLYGDSIYYFPTNVDWIGRFVVFNVRVKHPESLAGKLYFGGYDPTMTKRIFAKDKIIAGNKDFTYELATNYNPVTIDTTANVLKVSTVNYWWGMEYCITKFQHSSPAIWYEPGTCDSVQVNIVIKCAQF